MISFKEVVISLDKKGGRYLSINGDFDVGDFVLIVGQNGSGKTSLLDLIAGVRSPLSGIFKRLGYNDPVAYAVQDPQSSLMPWLSIIDNILLPSILTGGGVSKRNEVNDLLKKFGLLHRAKDYPYYLSGGERQIVNFIRAMYTPARIRLFDEVTASLHSSFKQVAYDVLECTNDDVCTFFISHDKLDLSLPFNRFLAIKEGYVKSVSKNEAEEILSNA